MATTTAFIEINLLLAESMELWYLGGVFDRFLAECQVVPQRACSLQWIRCYVNQPKSISNK